MGQPSVIISILNWNGAENTIRAAESVLKSAYPNYKLVIVDNASQANSVTLIATALPTIPIIRLKSNRGYAGAHQATAKKALREGFDLLWILNNDVTVFPDTLENLVDAYLRHGKALLGSVSLHSDGRTINYGGGLEMTGQNQFDKKYNKFSGEDYFSTEMEERQVSDLEGASLLIPSSLIRKFGFINTRYFLYCEETDYCYRLRNDYEIPSIIVPTSKVIHRTSASFQLSSRLQYVKAYYITRNYHLFGKRHIEKYKIEGLGNVYHCLRFFMAHYIKSGREFNGKYWMNYYTRLGYLHALLRIRGKYLKPEKFI